MFKNFATIIKGTVVGQGIGFLVLPLLTRLYDPEAFAHFQLYQSAMLVLVVFVSLRFEVAILRASDGHELRTTLALCILSTLAIALLLTVIWSVVVVVWPEIYALFPVPPWVLGPTIIVIGIFQFLGFLVTREQMYGYSANSKVFQAGTYAVIASGLGVFRVLLGMIIADAVARLIGSLYLLRSLRGRGFSGVHQVSFPDLKITAFKFREFPLITVFGGIINSLGIVVTPVMIYAKFSPEVSGQFALVDRAISLPLAMLVGAISQLYMSNFASAVRSNPGEVRAQFHSLLRLLLLIGTLPAAVAFFLAPSLFTFIFGEEWQLAGRLAQIMIPAYLIIFVCGGVNMTLMLLGQQVLQTAWEIIRLGCMLALWIFIVRPDMTVEVIVMLHSGILGAVSLLFLALAEYGVRKGPTKVALENG